MAKQQMRQFDDSEALELEADDLLDSLDANSDAAAEAAPIAIARTASTRIEEESPTLPAPPPMAADAALRELVTATDRKRIVEVLLGYAASTFEAAVVFTVRDTFAFGWRAIGDLPGCAYVQHLLIPLEAPSIVQAAIAAEQCVFHGTLTPSTINSYRFTVLGCAEPTTVTAGAIMIGKRVVNVLYGHGNPLSPIQIGVLQQICKSAAEAYARLIEVSKKRR